MIERRPRRVLLATDGSPSADAALDVVCAMSFAPEDRVEIVTVGDAAIAEIAEIAARAARRLEHCGVTAEIRLATGPVAEAILETARDVVADLIVVGSRGRGLVLGTLLGSTGMALTRLSPLPVLVARARRVAPRRVLLAVDGSPDSQAAASAVAMIPLVGDAEIVLLHVVPDTRRDNTRSRELLSLVASRMPPSVSTRIEIARGDVGDAILERAEALDSDLIALGSGHPPRAPLRGRTADRVLGAAQCCVLVARAAERAKAPAPVRAVAAPVSAAG